jgi:hypothetical protein
MAPCGARVSYAARFTFAHLALSAAAILLRPAAEIAASYYINRLLLASTESPTAEAIRKTIQWSTSSRFSPVPAHTVSSWK